MRKVLFVTGLYFLAMLTAGPCAQAVAAPTPRVTDRVLGDLYQKGDLDEMQRRAESGDVRAQHWMGLMLHNRARYDEAIHWYKRAVDQGDGRSANRIADFYQHGIGRPKDIKEAMNWHRKGAALGDFSSQLRYAAALRSGTVFARDEQEAFKWYAKAAQEPRFHPGYAYLPLAEMFEEGTAVPRDFKRAFALAKAAELTVDDSDSSSQDKARSIQTSTSVRMTPTEQRAADGLFQIIWPDLADRLERQSARATQLNWLVFILLTAVVGVVLRWTIKRYRRKALASD